MVVGVRGRRKQNAEGRKQKAENDRKQETGNSLAGSHSRASGDPG
jgi:hypothetical protein